MVGRDRLKDIAHPVTDHEKLENVYNIAPAISPDGSKLAIMRNDNIYWEARVMAAEALGHVVGRRESIGAELAHEVVEAMEAILARTQPSQFHDAIRRSLPTVGTREDRPEA